MLLIPVMLCVKPCYYRGKPEHAEPEVPGEIEFTDLRGGDEV